MDTERYDIITIPYRPLQHKAVIFCYACHNILTCDREYNDVNLVEQVNRSLNRFLSMQNILVSHPSHIVIQLTIIIVAY